MHNRRNGARSRPPQVAKPSKKIIRLVPEPYPSFLTQKLPQLPTSSSLPVDVHAARGTFLVKVTFVVFGRRGSLQITREEKTSPSGLPFEPQPTGVNGRPRCVLDDNEGWAENRC